MQWRNFFQPKRPLDSQLDDELRFHMDEMVEAKIAAGLSPEQARRETALEFGGREQIKEELHDVHRIATLENTLANLKSAFRFVRRSPSFSITIILTLALGIGMDSAVFSAINAIILRPLPFPNAGELVLLRQNNRKAKNPTSFVAPVRLEDWNRLNTTFQAISGWYTQDVSETSGVLPEKVTEALAAPRFFQVWGVSPAAGRDFSAQEMHFGGPNAAIISDRFWRRRFHADTNAIGEKVRLEGHSYPIVGIMPASFLFLDNDVDIWCPGPPDAPYAQRRDATWYTVIGRLKSGVMLTQARANMAAVQAELGRQFPKTDDVLAVEIQSLKESVVGGASRSLWLLFGAVSLLLLIACTNIASLLLARATQREREISVRFSLGAPRRSVIAQLLTESFVLALLGAALGLLAAAASSQTLRTLAKSLPRAQEITLDWRIVLYTLACTVIATLLCALLPAFRATRQGLAHDLARTSRTQVSTRSPLQWVLVGSQVALAVTLMVGAGLLVRTFQELARVAPGFEPAHVLTLRISGDYGETADYAKLTQRIDADLQAIRALPGVRAAATSSSLPGMAGDYSTEVTLSEGRDESQGKIIADNRFVSDGYFATMGIPFLAGEDCRESLKFDAAVVNRSFANKYLTLATAIGHHLQVVSNIYLPKAEIRGIAADVREQGLEREPIPTIYWCSNAPDPSPYFLIRTQTEPLAMAPALRREIHRIEPARSVYGIAPLEEHLSGSLAENRFRAVLLSLFALTAGSLACIGLFGTLSYFVSVRKREVGLRLGLGASQRQIVSRFVVTGLSVSFAGCLAGVCLALSMGRALASMLYGVSTTDGRTLFLVVLLTVTVTFLASLLPALRAARVDPMQVLRDE